MEKIDKKDRKILFHLLKDSRQSLKTIGKKVGISHELTSYRIRKLVNSGIITNFIVNINFEKLGYSFINYYYKFNNINPKIKKEIIDYFIKNKYSTYVSSIEGIYDFQVEFLMGDPYEYESIIDEIKKRFHKYLLIKFAESWIRGEHYNYPFLLNEKVNNLEPYNHRWGENIVSIDEFDFKILSKLSKDSRKTTTNLANQLNSTISIINYRIKKLLKIGIIRNYSINVDWSKIGYRWFHLRINLNDYDQKNKILKHIRENPYLIRILKGVIYNVDIHCTFLLKNIEELRKISEDISLKFPNAISNYQFYSGYRLYKHRYMIPKILAYKNPLCKTKKLI
jgi:Lrp/AsnC family transcriptional regulator, regulator for asnA, asnC and gidA